MSTFGTLTQKGAGMLAACGHEPSDMLSALKNDHSSETRLRWLSAGWVLFGATLFVVTWRLWTGQSEFPQVPLIALGHYLPQSLSVVGFIVILFSLLGCLLMTIPSPLGQTIGFILKLSLATFCVAVGVLMIANQHRLQPWAYLAWLTAILFFTCRAKRAVFLLRLLVISVYLHSAISKLDHQFLTTLGPTFCRTYRNMVGIPVNWGPGDQFVALLFPVTELLVGVGLYSKRTRRVALVAAVVMHLALICLFSPWGLSHEAAVLIWNAYFIWQVVILFGWWSGQDAGSQHQPIDKPKPVTKSPEQTLAERFATAVIGLAVLLPLLEPISWFDHWPAWGLYAPRNSRCTLYVNEDAFDRLPASWNWELVDTFDEQLGWSPGREVPLSRESLRRLHVPIYPQDRFQLGVALGIAKQVGTGNAVFVVWESASARMTGEREREVLNGVHEIESAAGRFWLNVEPR